MSSLVSPRLIPSNKLAFALLIVAFSFVGRSAPVHAIQYCPTTGNQILIDWENLYTGEEGTCTSCKPDPCPPLGTQGFNRRYQGCCPAN